MTSHEMSATGTTESPVSSSRDPLTPPGMEKAAAPRAIARVGAEDQDTEGGCGTSCCTTFLIIFSVILCILFFPFSLIRIIKIVPEYQRAVLFRLGRIKDDEPKGPGMFFILPCIDAFITVDLRTVSFDVPPQKVLSRDSVTVNVDAVVYFRIFDPIISVTNITDAGRATRLLAQTTLRNILGGHTLSEILASRDAIQQLMQQQLDEASDSWGVKVERVEIKDVRLPQELQRAMAAEAEASREAKAKVIAADGELNASRALKEAAEVIAQSPTALKLRYLQTLTFIAAEKGSTILFPIPMDMMGPEMMGGDGAGGNQFFKPPHPAEPTTLSDI